MPTQMTSDDNEEEDEDDDEPVVIDHGDFDVDIRLLDLLEVKPRSFSIITEDIANYGTISGCRGRNGIERGWKRPSAHFDTSISMVRSINPRKFLRPNCHSMARGGSQEHDVIYVNVDACIDRSNSYFCSDMPRGISNGNVALIDEIN